jgi:predicted dehydrogenase
MPLTVLERNGSVLRPELAAADPISAFVAELGDAVDSVEKGQPSEFLAGALARDALLLCHKQVESVKEDRAVELVSGG